MRRLNCPFCNTPLKVPNRLQGKRARCPKCRNLLTIPKTGKTSSAAADPWPPGPEQLEQAWNGHCEHPYRTILRGHGPALEHYSHQLYTLYDRIKKGSLHKRSFLVEKTKLKKFIYPPLLQLVLDAAAESFTLLHRISLWRDVLEILPHRDVTGESDYVRNSYPRYDLANIFGLGFAGGKLRNRPLAATLVQFKLDILPPALTLESILMDLRSDTHYRSLVDRTTDIIEQNELAHTHAKDKFRETFEQLYENFGFGFNWIAMHLDVEEAREEETT